jgi:hypothetical protein
MRTSWMSLGLSLLITLSITPFVASPVFAANSTGEVVDQINAIRIQNGLAPLIAVPQLNASAQSYASAMATGRFFAHAGPDGSTFSSRDEAAGYTNWTYLEENLAAGQPTVAAAVNAWMKSPAHRADLLSPRVTETGVGYVDLTGSPYGHYWVQEFGSRSTAPAPAPVVVAPIPVVSAAPTAPVVLAAVKTPSASTPVTIAAPPVTIAPITVTSAPRTVIARTQRDPDNLNLYLNLYRDLGFN